MGPGFLYWSPQLLSRAEELVNQSDVVHGHGLYVGPNQAFGLAARRLSKSLVYHVHGMFEPYILRRSRWKKQLAHWLFEDANFQHVCLWRALTSREANQIRACGIQAPIIVAPNGLNLEDFSKPGTHLRTSSEPAWVSAQKQKLRATFLGRLHPKKGLDLLLPAWARLSSFHKDWELVIAGPDEQNYLAVLRKMVLSLGLEEQIRFVGAVTGSAKVALLHSSDLFILPSYSEGFAMSILEAMACAVPVIASTACNFPEISQYETGWECQLGLSSVTETLEAGLRADSGERRQRGELGRCLVAKNYTWPSIIQTLLEACVTHCR